VLVCYVSKVLLEGVCVFVVEKRRVRCVVPVWGQTWGYVCVWFVEKRRVRCVVQEVLLSRLGSDLRMYVCGLLVWCRWKE
jgi:hypothetical protein